MSLFPRFQSLDVDGLNNVANVAHVANVSLANLAISVISVSNSNVYVCSININEIRRKV